MSIRFVSCVAIAACAALLGGCNEDRMSVQTTSASDTAAAGGGTRIVPSANLGGKWTLSAPGGGSCNVTLAAAQDASEGAIAPAGGCPLNFFTSRKWTFEDSGLVIRDHNGQPLAKLAQIAPNRFEGSASAGQAIALAR